jgi:hypothetical protein
MIDGGMNCTPYPFRQSLLAGLRHRYDSLRIVSGEANLNDAAHCFAFRQFGTSRFLSRLILLAQGF